ncbi:MAG: pyruvate kinase [Anaerolineae bacterium]|nr:MAG: pyruvate kinase [Anaerolineae bacterium]
MSLRKARIVATIGPASRSPATLQELMLAGMNVARLNFSHGTHADHAATIRALRAASAQTGRPISILQDLQGPKIRTGTLRAESITLHAGQTFRLTSEPVVGDEKRVSISYKHLAESVQPGGRILLDDGKLELRVKAIHGQEVETEVVVGGVLRPHKGVNLPGAAIRLSALTPKDRADALFGLKQGVDYIALSFVRTADDVEQLRHLITEAMPQRADTPIIAKLERPEALDNLEAILEVADGVMVARGDLGVEIPPERVPVVQKQVIQAANQRWKLVITATQMLESMITNPRPTRAEAADVANAIFDGSDAVMLSGETATGRYPVKAVEMMNAIISQAEAHMRDWGQTGIIPQPAAPHDNAEYIVRAAREMAEDKDVAAIAVFTQSGRTARLMSKMRPRVPILAFTPNAPTYGTLGLLWGVHPHLVPHAETVREMLGHVENTMIAGKAIQPGQEIVIVAGFPIGTRGPANFVLLHTVGKPLEGDHRLRTEGV